MKPRNQYKRILNFFANLVTLIVEAVLFAFIWYQYYSGFMKEQYFNRGNWAVIGMYLLIIFFFTKVFGGYKIGYLRITDICLSQVLAIVLGTIVAYFEICLITNDYVPPFALICISVIEVGFVIPWVYIIRRIFVRMYPPRKMIVIYGEHSPSELTKKINSRADKYNICASISYRVGYEDLYRTVLEYEAVVLCDLPTQVRNQILKFCFEHSLRTYVTPKLSDIIITGSEQIYLFDTPLYLSRNQGLGFEQRLAKRILDIICALVGLALTSPFLLITAICIKSYDGGPVFYRQRRVTIDHQYFNILKFRSMVEDSEKAGARLAMKEDDRITPIGRIIRRIHFDEIPQLINVLKGEMSFVGPRPERPEIGEEYEKLIPEFCFRLKVKAGLTGYAQVYGKYNTTPYDKLKLDLTYIENYSIWLDLKLILMTIKVLFQKENSEGVDKSQKTAISAEKNIEETICKERDIRNAKKI
ncbi:MAG: sugar transferase [Eubacterium sp.]|jgi:exopolysaccharide biosynthesis polyprenyl glycosylphosphotransferase|nr:sugar transferase [Eubacterium sp.]